MKFSTALTSLALVTSTVARTLTITNNCPFTVWPGISTGSGYSPTTGWEAPASSSSTIQVPDTWTAGRVWGRRDCDFSKPQGQDCVIGSCSGGLACTDSGVPPVTLAEFSLRQSYGDDYYDVSLVAGYGLPLKITPSASACHVAGCAVDLGPICPAPLVGPFDSGGFPVGCKSACLANLDGNPANSPNCCSGQYNTPQTCPSSGVEYYSFFKSNCPDTYAYPFDESSGTALWTCGQQYNSDYTITFCP